MRRAKPEKVGMFELNSKNAAIWAKLGWVTVLLLLLAFVIPLFGQIAKEGDAPVYRLISSGIWGGALPYRDIHIEYPPGALPFILLARPLGSLLGNYIIGFGLLAAAVFALVLRHLYRQKKIKESLALAILVLPILGLTFFELDIFSAVALYFCLVMLLKKKYKSSAALLAAAILVKAYPIVCLPALLAALPRQKIKTYLVTFTAVLIAGVVPFLILSPSGFWWSVSYHLNRPIQLESSLGAAGFVLQKFGEKLTGFISHKSYALDFPLAHQISTFAFAAMVITLGVLTVWVYRIRSRRGLALKCLALLVTFVIFFKVGSPQYLVSIVFVALLASDELSKKDKKALFFRLLALGLIIFGTFSVYFRIIALQWPAELLVVLRYVLLVELFVWTVKRIKLSRELNNNGGEGGI